MKQSNIILLKSIQFYVKKVFLKHFEIQIYENGVYLEIENFCSTSLKNIFT